MSCLAFAAAVMRGEKRLQLCPYLDGTAVRQLEGKLEPRSTLEEEREGAIDQLRSQVRAMDLAKAAQRLGASHSGNELTVSCLSKRFHIDSSGNVRSDCHTTSWLVIPLLGYILHGAGKDPAGKWILFKELDGGADWGRLFSQRCEKSLKRLVDGDTDLFEMIIDLFDGKLMENEAECDISVVIHPLPKVPILIRYWRKEGDFDSALTLLFDATASDNLGIEPLYMICVGLVTMFERIAMTHGRLS
jgi:hypothetical protein